VQDVENWDSWSQMRRVRDFVVNQNYKPSTFKNDIAMIRVEVTELFSKTNS
jgi:hypothetical protein